MPLRHLFNRTAGRVHPRANTCQKVTLSRKFHKIL
jgi:hypothetical protein